MSTRVRLDALLADRGSFSSRTAAARAVRAGDVRLGPDGPVALRPGQMVADETVPVVAERKRFVSRGGEKLEHALGRLGVDPDGLDCLDVGASTGGFTDCLLQRGATRVIALDVAYGQLDDRLRRDPRVIEVNRRNARELRPEELAFRPALATVDVSFISLAKVLPAVREALAEGGELLAMVKPQFELGRKRVGRGGVVREEGLRREAILGVARCCQELGLAVRGVAYSGLPGPKGNRETFVHATCEDAPVEDLEAALAEVEV
ncbi:MAG TPA: TlyA family RNA methyltransferase [Solirubrobacterales bacterium]|nr:TlyA family RNA methyltransferase [Solirubrobacterales bacterium]